MPAERSEAELLLSYLNDQRGHVLGILEGLDDADLRRPLLPSGWSCLGLVQHLAIDVERFWFRAVVAGERDAIAQLADTANAWIIDPSSTCAEIFDLYRHEITLADAVIATTPLSKAPEWWPEDLFGDWRVQDLRQILLHVMTETACHAGHLDAARELIDGRKWLVLT